MKYPKADRFDPTRTTTLRNKFQTDLRKRFVRIKGDIIRLIVDEDALGLKKIKRLPFESPIENKRWQFDTSTEQTANFLKWIKSRVATGLITGEGLDASDDYWSAYIKDGYRKGTGRAFDEIRKPVLSAAKSASVSDFFNGTREEFLRSAFANPVGREKVQQLAARTMRDLVNTTDTMAIATSRAVTDGLVKGDNPWKIARELNKQVDKGMNRSLLIARTEIIRAHAEGSLDAMEAMGVETVGVMVEWSTAGDGRVCQLCQPLEGVILKIKEAHGLIPRHPNCRCGFLPANVGEDDRKQRRTQQKIRQSMDKSIKAEVSSKYKTKEERKNASTWIGADEFISIIRPQRIIEPDKLKPLTIRRKKSTTPPDDKPAPPVPPKKKHPVKKTPPIKKTPPAKKKPASVPPKKKPISAAEKGYEDALKFIKTKDGGSLSGQDIYKNNDGNFVMSDDGIKKYMNRRSGMDFRRDLSDDLFEDIMMESSLTEQMKMIDSVKKPSAKKKGLFTSPVEIKTDSGQTMFSMRNAGFDTLGIDEKVKQVSKANGFDAVRDEIKKIGTYEEYYLKISKQYGEINDKSYATIEKFHAARRIKDNPALRTKMMDKYRKEMNANRKIKDKIELARRNLKQDHREKVLKVIELKKKDRMKIEPEYKYKKNIAELLEKKYTDWDRGNPLRISEKVDKEYKDSMKAASDFLARFMRKEGSDAESYRNRNRKVLHPTGQKVKGGTARGFHYRNAVYVTSNAERGTFVHEIGHAIENQMPHNQKLGRDFVSMRVKRAGKPDRSMKSVCPGCRYDKHEMGNEDEFSKLWDSNKAHYAGKTYGHGSTEILSLGLEEMWDDPVKFAAKDPEYFDFILGMMRGLL